MSEPEPYDVDEATLDDEYDEPGDELTDDELADALDWLHGPINPLAGYATPATRRRKPFAIGRPVHDVLPTL
ncbi:hypothetical protein [Streptomyces sp. NPDC006527]|jgi:hypothetical protein|uniref:hypothetical protein n=1 Tax=Streptomyces sp. NPDC006527 TaxID=3364749 RepID=UPI003673AF85